MKVHGLARVGSSSSAIEEMTRFIRDGLGLEVLQEQADARVFGFPDGHRGALFGVVPAALEIFDGPQADLVDTVGAGSELGRDHGLRVEVSDVDAIERLATTPKSAGATVTRSAWSVRAVGADLPADEMPDGEQLTISILPDDERRVRAIARQSL